LPPARRAYAPVGKPLPQHIKTFLRFPRSFIFDDEWMARSIADVFQTNSVDIIGWEDWVLEFLFDTLDIIWVIKVIIYFQSLKRHFNGGFMPRFSRPRLS
jgi:hypothetical protein